MNASAAAPDDSLWQRALNGDRDAFEAVIVPLHDDLMRFARHQVNLQRRLGRLQRDELTPEELMGEGLVAAYERRAHFDAARLPFRSWLLGLQHRALARIMRREARYASRKAISLDAEVPQNETQDAVEEALYEFRMPYDVTTYENLIPGSAPADVEIRLDQNGHSVEQLSEEERAYLEREDIDLSAEVRQVALFHDEFELTLPEVAQILDYSLKDTAEALNLARTSLREQIGSVEELDDPDDAIDSYTGDPVR
jgi:DNA-directed RNA polymerase specialized sigma24 family protein